MANLAFQKHELWQTTQRIGMKKYDSQSEASLDAAQTKAKRPPDMDIEQLAVAALSEPMLKMLLEPIRSTSIRRQSECLRRVVAGGLSRTGNTVLQMQRLYGNRHVQRVLALTRREEENAEVAPEVEHAINQARGSGQTLDSRVRDQMEAAFGTEFSDVRIHTGAEPDALNRAIEARAFTTGADIFFAEGEYQPRTASGLSLLAHELTHVVQQSGSSVESGLRLTGPSDPSEREADQVADEISRRSSQDFQNKSPDESFAPIFLGHQAGTVQGKRKHETSGEVVSAEGDIVKGDINTYAERVKTATIAVSTRARVNAHEFAFSVASACEEFQSYATPKLEVMESDITAGELASGLVGAVLGPLAEKITSLVTNEIGNKIANALVEKITFSIKDQVNQAVSGAKDKKSLPAVVQSLVKGAKLATNQMRSVTASLDSFVNVIDRKTQTGNDLTDDETQFLLTFMVQVEGPEDLDIALERSYGIPTPAKAVELQIEMFRRLVAKFEEKYILATAYWEELMRSSIASGIPGAEKLTVKYKAEQRAVIEQERYRKELRVTP